jgi:hypothetical protein
LAVTISNILLNNNQMKKKLFINLVAFMSLSFKGLPQLPYPPVQDKIIIQCLDTLSKDKNDFLNLKNKKNERRIVEIKENGLNESGERVLTFCDFCIVDLQDIDENMGKIIGSYKNRVVIYKTINDKQKLSSLQITTYKNELDSLLAGNKAAYAYQKSVLLKTFVDKDGKSLLDTTRLMRVASYKGFGRKITIRPNNKMIIEWH